MLSIAGSAVQMDCILLISQDLPDKGNEIFKCIGVALPGISLQVSWCIVKHKGEIRFFDERTTETRRYSQRQTL